MGTCRAESGDESQALAALLKAASEEHRAGRLEAAEASYLQALREVGLEVGAAGVTGGPVRSLQAAEALHLLGALRAQRASAAAGGQGEDSGDEVLEAPGDAEHASALSLLRAATSTLPSSAPAAARARLLNSLGVALLARRAGRRRRLHEAVAALREAALLDAGSCSAQTNLARVLARLEAEASKAGNTEEEAAILRERADALRAANRLRPDQPLVLYRLGMALKDCRDSEEAAAALERYLELADAGKGDATTAQGATQRKAPIARHWLAVVRGDAAATAPAEYVAGLFDSYADRFDDHLVNALGYQTPELIAAEIRGTGGPTPRRCADLGCGTGLMGPLLKELGVEHLVGVDLSAGMLAKAEGRGYDRLVCGDLLDVFGEPEAYDLVVAADVFVYVGDLRPVLEASARGLARPHGMCVVSTEAPPRAGGANECSGPVPAGGFCLADTGRYLHTATYVRETAEGAGMRLAARRSVVLRYNGGKPVHGHIHVFRLAG